MWFCLSEGLILSHFLGGFLDSTRAKNWFLLLKRWSQIKSFLKISNPEKDPLTIQDRMYRVRELFELFIDACTAN
jgi:hypothetical protein